MTTATVLKNDRENRDWVDEDFVHLAEQYEGKYVAVRNRRVIAADDSIPKLHEVLESLPDHPSRDEVTVVYLTQEPRGMLL
jgi:hypothetical protein